MENGKLETVAKLLIAILFKCVYHRLVKEAKTRHEFGQDNDNDYCIPIN